MLFSSLLSLMPAFSSSLHIPTSSTPSSGSNDKAFNYDIPHAHAWPSIHESAVAARRILKLHGISTLSSVFPASDHSSYSSGSSDSDTPGYEAFETRPASVAGAPIGLMDYHASCAPFAHDPLLIGVTIATTMRNAAAGSNVTLSLRYQTPSPPSPPSPPADDPWAYLPANLPRFALVGTLERLDADYVARHGLDACFFDTHPDARLWAPGGDLEPHEAWWARLRVREVYWFGGFGDRARIGWLPLDVYAGVTESEADAYRLPGEDGWLEQRAKAEARRLVDMVVGDDDDDEGDWEDPLAMQELK